MDELKSKLLKLVDENKDLKQKEDELEKKLYANMVRNYELLVKPVQEELIEMNIILSNASGVTFSVGGCQQTVCYLSNNFSGYSWWHNGHKIILKEDETWRASDSIKYFSDILSTEDVTLKFIDAIKEHFALRFEKYKEIFEKQNSELRHTVDEFARKLKESPSMIQNPDGSIEITINGKTYIGTVKEV